MPLVEPRQVPKTDGVVTAKVLQRRRRSLVREPARRERLLGGRSRPVGEARRVPAQDFNSSGSARDGTDRRPKGAYPKHRSCPKKQPAVRL